jgi:2'-5' RNA ligase
VQAASRFFYVLFLPESAAASTLDTIRLLANPSEKWRAHITVRGPYVRHLNPRDVATYNRKLRGNVITVDGVDQFANPLPGQYTVFFRCEGTALHNVWHKPSFPGYTPHITLYDGDRPEVAQQLREMAGRYPFHLQFRAERLEPMRSVKGQQRMDVSWNYVEIEGPDEQRIPWSLARDLPIANRLSLIETLFSRLPTLGRHEPRTQTNSAFNPRAI